jgi:hypothetical protein
MLYPVGRQQGRRRISSADDGVPTINHAPNDIQVLRELELMQHAQWGHYHHPHQPNVPLVTSKSQPYGNEDKHAGRLAGRPPQDDLPFGVRTSPTTTATAMRTHPSNVATAPAPHHIHRCNNHNVSDNASGTLPTSHLPCRTADGTPIRRVPWWSVSGTAYPLWRNPCPARASTGNNDVPLLRNVPAASSILKVRGGR